MNPKHYGYLTIDHRASPGLSGMPKYFEADTRACSHCRVVVMMNPERERERFTCPKCFRYCCDICATAYRVNFICRPWEQVVDEVVSGYSPLPLLAKDMKG